MNYPNSWYWNRQDKLYDRPGKWSPNLTACAPGYIGDKRNKLPGGFRRFQRWYKLPTAAWKLYWRMHK